MIRIVLVMNDVACFVIVCYGWWSNTCTVLLVAGKVNNGIKPVWTDVVLGGWWCQWCRSSSFLPAALCVCVAVVRQVAASHVRCGDWRSEKVHLSCFFNFLIWFSRSIINNYCWSELERHLRRVPKVYTVSKLPPSKGVFLLLSCSNSFMVASTFYWTVFLLGGLFFYWTVFLLEYYK